MPAMDEICEQCRNEPFVLLDATGWAQSVVNRISLKSVICKSIIASLTPFGIPLFLVGSPLVSKFRTPSTAKRVRQYRYIICMLRSNQFRSVGNCKSLRLHSPAVHTSLKEILASKEKQKWERIWEEFSDDQKADTNQACKLRRY